MRRISVIFYSLRENKAAVNALAAALDAMSPPVRGLRLVFALDEAGLFAEAEKALSSGRTCAAAFSFFSSQAEHTRLLMARLRGRFGAAVFCVAGGPHASALPAESLAMGFDAAASGEGEKTICALVLALARRSNWRDIAGIGFLNGGRLVFNKRPSAIDLNTIPPVSVKHHRYGPVEITRGCPHACKFCQTSAIFGRVVRHRSVEEICRWAGYMARRGLRDFRAITPNAFAYGSPDGVKPDISALERLLAGLRCAMGDGSNIFFGTFPSEVRPEHVTPRAAALVRCYADNDNIVIGAQSGSQRVLDGCNRGHTVKAVFAAAEAALGAGLKPNLDFIFNLPGETKADALLTMKAMNSLADMGARIHAHSFLPLPGSAFAGSRPANNMDLYRHAAHGLIARGALYGQWHKQAVRAGNKILQ